MHRLTLALALSASPPAAQDLPYGFETVTVVTGVPKPVGLEFSPQGRMYLINQHGVVHVHDGVALQPEPFLDLSDEVNSHVDRGMLGIALHPGFVPDGGPTSWVYLLYTVSPVPGQDLAFDEDDKYSFSRLTRYRAEESDGRILADPASRHVLLGNQLPDGSVPDCIASLHDSHSNGSLVFGEDGSLLVATGDGAHFDAVDTGGLDPAGFDDWTHPVTGLKGPTPAVQDSGAFRSQDLRSLAGKVLRLDPATGGGYPSNPFYDGDPESNASRVWALGLRNPFRVALLPGTGSADPSAGVPGALVIGDVGWSDWEELSLCRGGENFGWPCQEGFDPAPDYPDFDPVDPQFQNCNTPKAGTPGVPLAAWSHRSPEAYKPPGSFVDEQGAPLPGYAGVCAIGGAVYAGGAYPDEFDGRLFCADFGLGWIHTVELDEELDLVAVRPFAESLPLVVAIERHPLTGDLHYVTLTPPAVVRLEYFGSSQTYGCGFNPAGSLVLQGGAVTIGSTATLEIHNPIGTQSPGSATLIGLSAGTLPSYPCGVLLEGFGMGAPLVPGELLIDLAPGLLLKPEPGPPWPGTPVEIPLVVPSLQSLVGVHVYVQGMIVDPTFGGGTGAGIGLTEGIDVLIGG